MMATLDELTREMQEGLARSGGLGERSAKISFDEEGVIFLTGSTASNEDREADCTLEMSRSNYEALRTGRLNPTMALMTGKLKLRGDMALVMKLQGMFKPIRHERA